MKKKINSAAGVTRSLFYSNCDLLYQRRKIYAKLFALYVAVALVYHCAPNGGLTTLHFFRGSCAK